MFDEYFYSEFEVATVKRHPVRSECRNFGRVLRGWSWQFLEEGRETSLVNVATVKRHPVRSECRNSGRVLRGWPWQFLEEGQVTFLVNVATVKRHPVRSECHTLWGQKHTPFFSGHIPQQSGWISVGNMRECVKLPRLFGN